MFKRISSLVLLLVAAFAVTGFGQDAPPDGGQGGGPGGGGPGGGPGGFGGPGGGPPNFAQMQQQMNKRTQDALGMSDEDWSAIEPKVTKIRQAQQDLRTGGGRGGFGGPGGGGPGGGPGGFGGQPDQNQSAVRTKLNALKEVLQNPDASPSEVKAKLDDYRAARTAAKDELTKLQADLKSLVTGKQEAVLVSQGILE